MSISVLLLTFNEEVNLPRCLKSVAWCDDVVVLDSFSTDRTEAIAEAAGARVLRRRFDNFAAQRNYGLEYGRLKHDWILHLDADEVVPPELYREMVEVARSAELPAYRLSMKLIFQDRWIKHASMFPAYQVRFGQREQLHFKMSGHGQREDLAPEKVGTLKSSLLHYSFGKGWADWFEKHNRYSTAEAREDVRAHSTQREWQLRGLFSSDTSIRRRALKNLSSSVPGRPIVKFLYMYLFRRGFLDGMAGFQYCLLLVIYEFMIVLKAEEFRRSGNLEATQDAPVRSVGQAISPPVNGVPKAPAPAAHEPSHA